MEDNDLGYSIAQTLNNLSRRMSYQNRSYDEISKLIDKKEDLLAGTPAIQPVSNKDPTGLRRALATVSIPFTRQLNFTPDLICSTAGHPIYATADGIIKTAETREWLWQSCGDQSWLQLRNPLEHMVRVK